MAYKFSSEQGVYEYRGVRDLVFAEVLTDTEDEFTCGTVYKLSPVATVTRTTENSSEPHYYDNQPLIVVTSTGGDELSLTIAPMDLQTYAIVTGQFFDESTGTLIEGERESKYFAIGYKTKGTDGKERYVWRLKGMFSIPDEEYNTEDDSADTTNTEITWTGVSTIHKFDKTGNPAKALICDERYDAVDLTTFFDSVQTPDTLEGNYSPRTLAPQIFPTVTTFSNMVQISMVCDTASSVIYYTTDGTEPASATATEYTTPFIITATTTIKAIATSTGVNSSHVVTKTYTKKS
ncbi:MAG: chitobiase/beta-hexosaminidase C-terminal domain-containing protein [Ruminococcus sp.]|nr:chitobiase/beta-hexosaminidase C-terminal domain-containing protein [Ruminococcus sp.]